MIIASKISLHRNFKDFNFTPTLTYEDSKIIADEIKKIFKTNKKYKIKTFEKNEDINELNLLNSKNIVSDNFKNNDLEKLLLSNEDMTTNILINEEDHIVINAVSYDDKIIALHDEVKKLEEKIDKKFPFAFDDKYGYLTSSLQIVGTGMIASYIVHIPMLELSGQLQNIKQACNKFGYDIKPFISDEEKSNGGFYEIYAKLTLGISEKEILSNLKLMILKMVEKEKILRNEIMKKEKLRMSDEINRAYGIVTHAKLIQKKEAEVLLSYIKLGCDLKLYDREIIDAFEKINMYDLLISIDDKALKFEIDSDEKIKIDQMRAIKIQEKINELMK